VQGTLLVASLEAGTSRQELALLFSRYGELRGLGDDPLGRPNCCLVEYYDTRHAGEPARRQGSLRFFPFLVSPPMRWCTGWVTIRGAGLPVLCGG
jgi:hypothetical protein